LVSYTVEVPPVDLFNLTDKDQSFEQVDDYFATYIEEKDRVRFVMISGLKLSMKLTYAL
jgi:hypothetical protein